MLRITLPWYLLFAGCASSQQITWQTDWDKFVDEYNRACTRDAKCESQRFAGKAISWKGKIAKIAARGAPNDEPWRVVVTVSVTPRVITGEDGKPLPGAFPEKARDLRLHPETEEAAAKWKQATVGDTVLFRAVFDTRGPILYSRIDTNHLYVDTSLQRPELIEIVNPTK